MAFIRMYLDMLSPIDFVRICHRPVMLHQPASRHKIGYISKDIRSSSAYIALRDSVSSPQSWQNRLIHCPASGLEGFEVLN
jgi:hypothetical protein